jgi:hypothetical protein
MKFFFHTFWHFNTGTFQELQKKKMGAFAPIFPEINPTGKDYMSFGSRNPSNCRRRVGWRILRRALASI